MAWRVAASTEAAVWSRGTCNGRANRDALQCAHFATVSETTIGPLPVPGNEPIGGHGRKIDDCCHVACLSAPVLATLALRPGATRAQASGQLTL